MRRVTIVVSFFLFTNAVTAGDFCESNIREEQEVCVGVNKLRARRGLDAVRLDRHLSRVAEAYAGELARRKKLTHGDFRQRMERAGVSMPAAENIAKGQKTPADVISDWTRSRVHYRNMTGRKYKRVGVGYQDGYWVQIFN
jgi:uncharacterized protein YkwD